MSDYHKLGIREKRAAALDAMREQPMRCPACDVACSADDLLRHQAERCPGRPAPHPRSSWIDTRQVQRLGMPERTARWLADKGSIRARGRGLTRQYLKRDIVTALARDRAAKRYRRRSSSASERQRAPLTGEQNHDRDADMEKLLTTNEVAAAIQLSTTQVRELRRRGDGPPFSRIGRAIRYRREDVEAWVEAQRVAPDTK